MNDSKARPRIGVSCNFMHADPDRALFRGKTLQYVEARMAKAVWRAGGQRQGVQRAIWPIHHPF